MLRELWMAFRAFVWLALTLALHVSMRWATHRAAEIAQHNLNLPQSDLSDWFLRGLEWAALFIEVVLAVLGLIILLTAAITAFSLEMDRRRHPRG